MCKYYEPIYNMNREIVGIDEMGYPIYVEFEMQVGFICTLKNIANTDCTGCINNIL